MKKYFSVLFVFFIGVLILSALKVEAVMPLIDRIIVIDIGHGAEDVGTSYGNIYEKDINLAIGKFLEMELGSKGASVILTRDGDYDLSTPDTAHRKKSDFDNRIKLINESNADIYVSLHLNYLSDTKYFGSQVFYLDNSKSLAEIIQKNMNSELNGNRNIKKIPNNTYMYRKINIPGVLIECGFLSNSKERSLLVTKEYQQKVAHAIAVGIIEYF